MRELSRSRGIRRLVGALLGLVLASGVAANEAPRVVVVNHALQHMAERLLGEAAEVVFPVPADVDPSFWRPSIAQISEIQSADLILLNGAGFATWVDRVSLPRSRVVDTSAGLEDRFIVTESITHSHGEGGEHSHDAIASYIWLDPTLASAQAEAVAAEIIARELAPDAEVDARLSELQADLDALDAEAQEVFAEFGGVPMIATHPRYQYLARRYDLTIAALEWEAGALPGPEQLGDLEALVAETGARILIWEAAPPPAGIAAADALGLSSVVFAPLAHGIEGLDFVAAFSHALSEMAQIPVGAAGN